MPGRIRIETPKLRQRFTFLNRFEQESREGILQALEVAGTKVVERAQQILLQEGKVATGDLINGFLITKNTTGSQGPIVTVSNTADGAAAVENGRAAGERPPPPDALREWAEAKGLPSDPAAIYNYGKKIARDGIPPTFFMQRAGEEGVLTTRRQLQNAIRRAKRKARTR